MVLKSLLKVWLISLLIAGFFSCKHQANGDQSSGLSSADASLSSTYLVDAGDNAKIALDIKFKEMNALAAQQGSDVQYLVVDAQDPRLYPNGGPFQPPSPAEKAVVKVGSNGEWIPTGLIQDQPGYFSYKDLNGQKQFWFAYNNKKIEYRSAYVGLFASVKRNRTTSGFIYNYYVKGYGNNVSSAQFDQFVLEYLDSLVKYVVSR